MGKNIYSVHNFLHEHTGLFYCEENCHIFCMLLQYTLFTIYKHRNTSIVPFFSSMKKYPPKIENIQLFHHSFCSKSLYVLMKRLTFTCITTVPICDSTGIAPKYFPLNFALGKMKCGLLSFTSTTFTLTCRILTY